MTKTLNEAFLEQKVTLGEKLYLITTKIFNQTQKNEFMELATLMNDRDEVIAEIKYLDKTYQDKCDFERISTPIERTYITKLRYYFQEVQKMDNQLTEMLEVELDQRFTELHKIKNAKKINKAYNSYNKQGSFFDKQR